MPQNMECSGASRPLMVWPALSSVSSETHLHERAKESPVDVQPDQQCQKGEQKRGSLSVTWSIDAFSLMLLV